jgi:hypothetical protein
MLEMHFSFYLFSLSKMSLTWSTTFGLSSMMETISLSCCKQFLKYFGTKSYLSILALKSLSSYPSLNPKYSFTFPSLSLKSKACCKKAYRCFLVVISIKVDGFPFFKPDKYSFMLKFWYVFLKITTSLMGLFIKIKAPFSGIYFLFSTNLYSPKSLSFLSKKISLFFSSNFYFMMQGAHLKYEESFFFKCF